MCDETRKAFGRAGLGRLDDSRTRTKRAKEKFFLSFVILFYFLYIWF